MKQNPGRLASVCAAVEQSCQLLLDPRPSKLDRSVEALSKALEEMTATRSLLSRGDAGALTQARQIQIKLDLAARLLENAASYHSGWNRILRSFLSGYTPHGAADNPPPAARLAVEG